jgi:hypothetical protein
MLTLKMLNELAERLPFNSAFYRQFSGKRAWASSGLALGERYELVHSDVALGWHLHLLVHRGAVLFTEIDALSSDAKLMGGV